MPKSSASSSLGGKLKEKSKALAIAGLAKTNKKESFTPLGSSTEQTHQSGSSTQQPSQTLKQTKEDYAFPIQTLMALQDQGLTKLQKKSWADIASEKDEDSESISLALMIQNLSQYMTKANQPKQIKLKKSQTQYLAKEKFMPVIQLEPKFWDKTPNKIPSKIFPKDFHFRHTTPNRTQKYYEFILIDSNSVSIKYYKDKSNPSNITHSTFQILKILTSSEFGKNPNNIKRFSQNFDPIGYNYWDYIQAWTNVFWFQNKAFLHSWLIYFKRNALYNFLHWFFQWWNFFGSINQILPADALQGFQTF